MKYLILFLSFTAFSQKSHNFMTFNIRLDVASDSLNRWEYRKDNFASMVRFYQTDICGMQEVLHHQLLDIQKTLPEFDYVGLARDDAKTKGEYSPIFYNKTRYKLLASNTLWLNEHPDTPGLGWDAKYNRICTWAYFKDQKTKKKFYVFNTHFDHQAVTARRESAKLILKWVAEIAKGERCVLMGDFNAIPSDEPIQLILEKLQNTKAMSLSGHFGPNSSFNGFKHTEQEGREIDFIFVNNPNFKVLRHGTLTNTWAGRYASDHHAVLTEIAF